MGSYQFIGPDLSTDCFKSPLSLSFGISASPTLQAAPRPTIVGLGFGSSASIKLRNSGDITVLVMTMVAACLLTDVPLLDRIIA